MSQTPAPVSHSKPVLPENEGGSSWLYLYYYYIH
jgi:hypothetical protein